MQDAQFQYVEGQARPTFATLLAGYEALGAAAIRSLPCSLDLPYGAAERQVFDFFPASGQALGTLLYFHAGYWQSRDKATFRFIAPALVRRGWNVALVNYPLCPAVSLAALLDSCRASVPAIRAHARTLGQDDLPLVAAGHSAGGHIAVELALHRWPQSGPDAPAVDGVIALSGIYDLAPLLATTLNLKLGLDPDSATGHSPLHRVTSGAPPALFAAGGAETPAFIEQSTRMRQAWLAAGNRSELEIVAGADHFSLLEPFTAPVSALAGKVDELLLQAREAFLRRTGISGARP
jgi:arylformamidase